MNCIGMNTLVWLGLLVISCGGKAELMDSRGGSGGDAGTGGGTSGNGGTQGGASGGGSGGTAGGGAAGSGGAVVGGSGGAAVGGSGGTTIGPPPDQTILFEVSYENYAWIQAFQGIYITVEGEVFAYDFYEANPPDSFPPPAYHPSTEEELRERWGSISGPIGKVPVEELLQWYGALETLAQGVVMRDWACADAGEQSYFGYLYDPDTKLYTRVLGGVDGDLSAMNMAQPAEGFVTWLAQVWGKERYCDFRGAECTGVLCAAPSPDCGPGNVPSVENGCWGPCVPVTRCRQVPDCSWCGGQVCATSGENTIHCPFNYCAGLPCPCPTNPCGGGTEYCFGDFSEIVCQQP